PTSPIPPRALPPPAPVLRHPGETRACLSTSGIPPPDPTHIPCRFHRDPALPLPPRIGSFVRRHPDARPASLHAWAPSLAPRQREAPGHGRLLSGPRPPGVARNSMFFPRGPVGIATHSQNWALSVAGPIGFCQGGEPRAGAAVVPAPARRQRALGGGALLCY